MSLYPGFFEAVKDEFERIKAKNFEEEFMPSRLIKYTVSGFDHILHSHSEGEDEDAEDGSEGSSSSGTEASDSDAGRSADGMDEGTEEEDDDADDGQSLSKARSRCKFTQGMNISRSKKASLDTVSLSTESRRS